MDPVLIVAKNLAEISIAGRPSADDSSRPIAIDCLHPYSLANSEIKTKAHLVFFGLHKGMIRTGPDSIRGIAQSALAGMPTQSGLVAAQQPQRRCRPLHARPDTNNCTTRLTDPIQDDSARSHPQPPPTIRAL